MNTNTKTPAARLARRTTLLSLLALAALALRAGDPEPATTSGSADETVLVTADRVSRPLEETIASVTVIERAQIEESQARSVEELLSGAAGLEFTNNGGPGKATSLFMRGTESDHLLVLVDGVKIGSATIGSAALHDLPLEQVERIEIVRGPRSGLYGAEALGGVIQIFTRRGGGPIKARFHAGGGSYKSREFGAGLSGGGERAWFSAGAAKSRTAGIDACRGYGAPFYTGCYTDEPDRDGYENSSGTLRAGYQFSEHARLEAHWLRAEGRGDYDGSFANQTRTVTESYGAHLRGSLGRWSAELSGGRSRDQADDFLDGVFGYRYETTRDSASLVNRVRIAAGHEATLGFDVLKDAVGGTTLYDVDSRTTRGLFAQYAGKFGAHRVQLALRHDRDDRDDARTTGNLGWSVALGRAHRVRASYGTGYKRPTFNELYYPYFGNPLLDPERSRSAELGAEGRYARGGWSASLFRTEVTDLIGYDAYYTPVNIDETRLRGVELSGDATLAGWRLAAHFTLLDAVNRTPGAQFGNELPRRARTSGRLDADRAWGAFSAGASLHGAGRRFDDLANTRELGGYWVTDLRGAWRFAKDWRLEARVANLLDRSYETAEFYNQPGRSYSALLRYQP